MKPPPRCYLLSDAHHHELVAAIQQLSASVRQFTQALAELHEELRRRRE